MIEISKYWQEEVCIIFTVEQRAGYTLDCALNQKKQWLWWSNFENALSKSPVNIKGDSWRLGALSEYLWRNVTCVSSCCQMLHEQLLAHSLLPVDYAKIGNLINNEQEFNSTLSATPASPVYLERLSLTLTWRCSSSRMLDVLRLRWSRGGFMLWRKFMPIEASWIIWSFFGHIKLWLARRLFRDPLLMYSITMPVASLHSP